MLCSYGYLVSNLMNSKDFRWINESRGLNQMKQLLLSMKAAMTHMDQAATTNGIKTYYWDTGSCSTATPGRSSIRAA